MLQIGVLCFGAVLGYVTYRMLIRTTANAAISDLATVVSAVGGGLAAAFAAPETDLFGWYGVGLAGGFLVYGVGFYLFNGKENFAKTMGEPHTTQTMPRPGGPH
jgi:hypothetical protein